MISLLIGGVLVCVVAYVMLLVAAFSTSIVWGLLCLFFTPLQIVFVVFHWKKTWDAVMLLVLGWLMILAFFVRLGGVGDAEMQQAKEQLQQVYAQQIQGQSATEVAVGNEAVKEATQEAGGQNEIVTVDAPVTTEAPREVVAAPEKKVDTKPIYKCTDPQGNETFSREPCKGGVIKAPK